MIDNAKWPHPLPGFLGMVMYAHGPNVLMQTIPGLASLCATPVNIVADDVTGPKSRPCAGGHNGYRIKSLLRCGPDVGVITLDRDAPPGIRTFDLIVAGDDARCLTEMWPGVPVWGEGPFAPMISKLRSLVPAAEEDAKPPRP